MPWIEQPRDPNNPDATVSRWEPAEGEPETPPPSLDTDGLILVDETSGLTTWECRRCPDLGIFDWRTSSAVVMAHIRWHKMPWWYRLLVPRPRT